MRSSIRYMGFALYVVPRTVLYLYKLNHRANNVLFKSIFRIYRPIFFRSEPIRSLSLFYDRRRSYQNSSCIITLEDDSRNTRRPILDRRWCWFKVKTTITKQGPDIRKQTWSLISVDQKPRRSRTSMGTVD